MAVVLLQYFNCTEEEWVLRYGAHGVIGDTGGGSTAYPGGISQKRIQATVAALFDVRNETPLSSWEVYSRRRGQCMFHRSAQG